MTFADTLRNAAREQENIVCLGFDPVLERIPLTGDCEEIIVEFHLGILGRLEQDNLLPAAVKPNIAYFEQYGPPGLRALARIISYCKERRIPVILDAKRGDIGRSSAAYAKAAFDIWQAEAVTVAPYMGWDSIAPFIDDPDHGAYVLVRTSNPGAKDVQDLGEEPVFISLAKQLAAQRRENLGAVIGATYPQELAQILTVLDPSTPLLIPGVGAQGGSADEIIATLNAAGHDLTVCRINSTSAIMYAHEKNGKDYKQAAADEMRKLRDLCRI